MSEHKNNTSTPKNNTTRIVGTATAIALGAIPLLLGGLDTLGYLPFAWGNALLLYLLILGACFWKMRT